MMIAERGARADGAGGGGLGPRHPRRRRRVRLRAQVRFSLAVCYFEGYIQSKVC
jgi:hypothetical protein